jgi:hypothetical protein
MRYMSPTIEVEPPVVIDARLPAIRGLVVLLGMQGRMLQIANQEINLLDKRF